MSSEQNTAKKVVAPKDSGGEDDDLGILIYRESQPRKAEAAAAESKNKLSIASTRRTSTRKRTAVNHDDKSMKTTKTNLPSKKMKRHSSKQTETTEKKVDWTKYKKKCSVEGCTNIIVRGGVCVRHGAKVKKRRYECSSNGCTNLAQKGGVCRRHGAKHKRCSSEGCTNVVVKGGVCIKHGAKVKRCDHEGCLNQAQKGGVCMKHGAKKKRCSNEGCANYVQRGGVCRRHGAYRNTLDESTAFGSEYERTTATQTLPNHRASRAAVREQQGRSVPEEVTILCQEIVEV
jgi:hypothetical protein